MDALSSRASRVSVPAAPGGPAAPSPPLLRRLLAVLGCTAGALLLLGGCVPAGRPDPSRTAPAATDAGAPQAPLAASELESAYERVIRNVLPSVVQIRGRKGLGSGVLYDAQGHVVTNAHVVGDERTFRVTSSGSGTLTGKLVYSYKDQDLAVIKLNRVPDTLKAARFGDSSAVRVGQIVLAMGSPLGLASSVTQGIVSATGRTVSEGGGEGSSMPSGTGATIVDMVQTSAAINPGNSGGALVGLDGRVIGIPTLAATDPNLNGSAAPGIGFAIPAHTVTTVAGQIIKDGRVTDSGRAALGVTVRTVLGDDYKPDGASVVRVKKGDAADRAGLKAGDVITGLGTTKITTITSLTEALARHKPGRRLTLTYQRDGHTRTAQVTLSSM